MWNPFFNKEADLQKRIAPIVKSAALHSMRICLVETLDEKRPILSSINCIIDAAHQLGQLMTNEEKQNGIIINCRYKAVFKRGRVSIDPIKQEQ